MAAGSCPRVMIGHQIFFEGYMDTSIESLLTTAEVAALLRKSPRTVESWRIAGHASTLPFVNVEGQPRYRRSDVQAYIESHVCKAAPRTST